MLDEKTVRIIVLMLISMTLNYEKFEKRTNRGNASLHFAVSHIASNLGSEIVFVSSRLLTIR